MAKKGSLEMIFHGMNINVTLGPFKHEKNRRNWDKMRLTLGANCPYKWYNDACAV